MPLGPFSAKDHLEITTLGTEFALAEIVGVAAGYWLDNKFGTLPWCLVGGAVLGFVLGMWRIVQAARQVSKEGKKHGRS